MSESDSTVLVRLNKNKPLANPLEVVVTALTLEEAHILGCLSLNTSLKHAAAGTYIYMKYVWFVDSVVLPE